MRPTLLVALVLVSTLVPISPASSAGCSSSLAHDCLADALDWNGRSKGFTSAGATMEPGEPTCAAGSHHSVWVKLTVLEPGTSDRFDLSLYAPHFVTLGVYLPDTTAELAPHRCSSTHLQEESETPVQPSANLECVAGRTYWIQVTSQGPGVTGPFQLSTGRFLHWNRTLSAPCPFTHSVPEAPVQFRAAGGAGFISTAWAEPWTGGIGVPITHYNVYRAQTCAGPFSLLGSTTGLGHTDGGYGPGESRCYRVAAVNHLGEGALTSPDNGTTMTVPSAPQAVAVVPAGDGELRLSWQPPAWTGNPIASTAGYLTGYRIYRVVEGVALPLADVSKFSTEATMTGLGRGATQTYRIVAVNAVGEGPAGTATGTTWDLPGAPRDVRATAQLLGGMKVTWSAPSETTPFVTYRIYGIASSGEASFVGEVPRGERTWSMGGLSVFPRTFEVRAWNPAGEGAPSAHACDAWPTQTPLTSC